MKWNYKRLAGGCLGIFAAIALTALKPTTASPPKARVQEPVFPAATSIEVVGKTQSVPRGRALIGPVPLHPVVEVLVAPGDRVKKEQPLVKIDDDEQQAEVRVKKAALETAGIAVREARRYYAEVEKYRNSLPMQKYHEVLVASLKAEKDERAANTAVEAAEAELEHYTVVAPIDGVVNWLDVNLGMVSRPGTTVWGEILDLSEIDVRCELSPDQADQVAVGQPAEVRSLKQKELLGVGKVVFVGFAANKATGLVPVTVRLANPKWRLRCEIPVQVRFTLGKDAG